MFQEFIKEKSFNYSQNSFIKSLILCLIGGVVGSMLIYTTGIIGLHSSFFSLDIILLISFVVAIGFPLLFSGILYNVLKFFKVVPSFQGIYSITSYFILLLGGLQFFYFVYLIGFYLILILSLLLFVLFLMAEYKLSISFKGTNKILLPFSLSLLASLSVIILVAFIFGVFSFNSSSGTLSLTFFGQKYGDTVFSFFIPNAWKFVEQQDNYFVFEKGSGKLFGSSYSQIGDYSVFAKSFEKKCTTGSLTSLLNGAPGKIVSVSFYYLSSIPSCSFSVTGENSTAFLYYGVCPKGVVSLSFISPKTDADNTFSEITSSVTCT